MNRLVSSRRALGTTLMIAFLSGCSANQAGLPTSSAGRSSMAAYKSDRTTAGDLLYIVDSASGVLMYTYPGGEKVGLIKVNTNGGLCSDKNGNVFVTDPSDSEVLEYAHGGDVPIATLFPDAEPVACSVDPNSGNLATVNQDTDSKSSISIFKKATGKPKKYFDLNTSLGLSCSYDDKGNLYATAGTQTAGFLIAKLPKASDAFINISVDASIRGGNFLQWDGKYIAVTNAAPHWPIRVLQISISGSTGTVVNKITLMGSIGYFKYFWIQNKNIITPRNGGGWKARKIGFWAYPTGGKPFMVITLPKAKGGIAKGITVSVGSARD